MTTTTIPPDVPLGGLPPATHDLLRHAPLQVAVAEIRWARTGTELDEDRGLELRDAAAAHGLHLPRVEPVRQQQVRIDMTPEGPVPTLDEQSGGIRLTAADASLSVTVSQDSLVVQCNVYRQYRESLAPQIASAAAAVRDVVGPHLVQRVGLRYINQLVDDVASAPLSWRGKVDGSFLGPLLHLDLGPRVVVAQQQVEMQLDETSGAIVRHGPFQDAGTGTYAYLLDIDVFDNRSERFDVDALGVLVRALNRSAYSLFQQIVTPEWRATMGPYTEDTPAGENAQGHDTDAQEEAR